MRIEWQPNGANSVDDVLFECGGNGNDVEDVIDNNSVVRIIILKLLPVVCLLLTLS